MTYAILKNHHLTLILRAILGYIHEKKGAANLELAKPGAVLCQKRGAVVSQLILKLKQSVPPPPGLHCSIPKAQCQCTEHHIQKSV